MSYVIRALTFVDYTKKLLRAGESVASATSLFEDAKQRKYNFHGLDTRRDFENLFTRLATSIPVNSDRLETLDVDIASLVDCDIFVMDFIFHLTPETT